MATVLLLAAVLVSLALGVLTAYGICYGMFHMFQSKAVAQKRVKSNAVGVLAER
jgi:uncharacterized membrane protein